VPYRESLITRLFKDFFKSPGKCEVAEVIVTVAPNVAQFGDTNFSLSFAIDASKCCITETLSGDIGKRDGPDSAFQQELAIQTRKYSDHSEKGYQAHIDGIMQKTRCPSFLQARVSEFVPRADYEQIQRENLQLRERLNEAIRRIAELLSD
jgi:hypothetical protein